MAFNAIQEAQRLIMDDAAILPLVEGVNIMAHRSEVKGFRMHFLGWQCWKHLDTCIERETRSVSGLAFQLQSLHGHHHGSLHLVLRPVKGCGALSFRAMSLLASSPSTPTNGLLSFTKSKTIYYFQAGVLRICSSTNFSASSLDFPWLFM